MNEDKKTLIWVDFKCSRCGKPILGHKHMRIKGRHYHMTCGIALAKEKEMIKV